MGFDSHPSLEIAAQKLSFFQQKPRLLVVSMFFLFSLAGAVRLYNIEAPGLALDREYRSAILARAYYFEQNDSIEEWRKGIAFQTKQNMPILEPSITEFLVSLIYRVVGREQLWFARFLTSAFWLLGGIFLYRIVRSVVSPEAAVFATAYYLFVPLGILASRSFQPDALMMLLFLISLFAIIQYYDQPSVLRLLTAALISGLAILYRPLVMFPLMGVFIVLAIYKDGALRTLINKKFWLFIALSLLPFTLYYGYAILVAGFLRWKAKANFMPHLFLTGVFWKEWLLVGSGAVGLAPLVAALLGTPILKEGIPRALLIGLGIGYIIFCLAFNYYIQFAGYYHLQLIPIVALPLGALLAFLANYLRRAATKWYWWIPVSGAVFLVTVSCMLEVRSHLGRQVFESTETAQEIGEIVGHSTRVVHVAYEYGVPLEYLGEFTGVFWPRRSPYALYRRPDEKDLTIGERLNGLGFTPDYFVITSFDEFNRHHADLREFLASNCSLVAESERYLIYNACTK